MRRIAAAVFTAIGLLAGAAQATVQTERAEIRAGISTQSTFHHKSFDAIDWVQQRHDFRGEL